MPSYLTEMPPKAWGLWISSVISFAHCNQQIDLVRWVLMKLTHAQPRELSSPFCCFLHYYKNGFAIAQTCTQPCVTRSDISV